MTWFAAAGRVGNSAQGLPKLLWCRRGRSRWKVMCALPSPRAPDLLWLSGASLEFEDICGMSLPGKGTGFTLCHRRGSCHAIAPFTARRNAMGWTTPVLIEICIGLEINGYLPAEF
jgi:coenzyme PQQ precursor peptide PqqA